MTEPQLELLKQSASATSTPTPAVTSPDGNDPSRDATAGSTGAAVSGAAASTPTEVYDAAKFLETIPSELREQFEEGQRALKARKDALISAIKQNKSNPFSDQELGQASIQVLTKYAQLAQVPDHTIRAAGLTVQSTSDGTVRTNTAPTPPELFPAKAA